MLVAGACVDPGWGTAGAGIVLAEHPRLRCLQHHAFFTRGQLCSQLEKPAKQSYGMGYLVVDTGLRVIGRPAQKEPSSTQDSQKGHSWLTRATAMAHAPGFPAKVWVAEKRMRLPQVSPLPATLHTALQGAGCWVGAGRWVGAGVGQPRRALRQHQTRCSVSHVRGSSGLWQL
mmetsp:Transcript_94468/g.267193  ORF Transcript_94468/g.267193 Transcript_94468/m.267193 type:complete len:173 (+) Transcript_94468:589-1107(+)